MSFAFTKPASRKIAITVAIVQGLSIAVISPDPVAVCRRRQQAAIDKLERRAFSVQAMHPIKDKRARLRVAARYIKNGTVKFPRTGCERLLSQLFSFGSEKHDDLVDALVYLILGVAGEGIEAPKVHYV